MAKRPKRPRKPAEAAKPGGVGALLADPEKIAADCATIRRAFKERWPIPEERRQRILTVLQQIVETDTFEVERVETAAGPNGEGIGPESKRASIKMPNHRNQVAAAKAILAATGEDRDDQQHLERIAAGEHGPPGPKQVHILVVDGRGNQKAVGSLREFYEQYPATLALPDRHAAGPEQAEGGEGRPARG